ncbi:Predicted arabinose efflux permease, MFS family [Cryobacterium flavum]|uniref:MFS transporter n=1 Tax=Cryobacterium flavum TaxID=1424659 RepID=A0A4R8V4J5_9MICO|nr:MFS transporter [Cryobacterium flavum]TFB76005.1 MFS transporter [Cryobacterium flavum]SDO04732.1 Predicted arabinose efflux permease, MFS family [Cryobacterium flavum]
MSEIPIPGRRRSFSFAIIATMLLMVAASAPSPFYPQFAEQLGLLPVATTLIFAVYAFTMLAALLLTGVLSDVVGRRPVITVGSVLLAVSLVMFWQSGGLTMLLVARALQGVAAGLLLPALSAMVVDFAPPKHAEAASLWNTIAAMTGLGIGAITAAIVLDLTVNPAGAVFGSLAIVFLLIAALVWATPETSRSARLRVTGTTLRLAVPAYLRRALMVAVPAIIAGWATNGLFLALGSSVVKSEFGATTHAGQSIAIPIFAVSGIIASVLLHRRSARVVSVYGTSALGIGTALSLGALALHSLPAYLITVAVVGTGFGTAFMGVLKTLMPRVDPTERAAVMAVIYTVSYLAFGVPTIVAGLLVPIITLQGAMIGVGVVIVVLCLVATVKRVRIRDRSRTDPHGPVPHENVQAVPAKSNGVIR